MPAFCPNVTAMSFDYFRSQVQTDPKTGDMPGIISLYAVIAVKDLVQVIGLNSYSFVFYANDNVAAFFHAFNFDTLSFRGVFDGITDKIENDRADLIPVGI